MSAEFPDTMLDIETTGLNVNNNHILQIAAVNFNLKERTIDAVFFDRCLLPAPQRYWDENTRNWWAKKADVLATLKPRMEDPQKVLEALTMWAGSGQTMYAKPTHFDHSFLSNYYEQFDMQIPFHFRSANDMNSMIRGMFFPAAPPDLERNLPFDGPAHNALFDCLHQIKVLFAAADIKEGKAS